MNGDAITALIGRMLLLLAALMLAPAVVGLGYGEHEAALACVASAAIVGLLGSAAYLLKRSALEGKGGALDSVGVHRREGLAVVGLTWVVGGVCAALPFLLAGTLRSPIDAIFEAISGLTTTGSTVMTGEQIDGMSHAIAFWRSFTHWLGGFGIVMVFVVLFPTGGRSLFRSEIPGIAREAGRQRVRDSAVSLLWVYLGLSVVQFVLLHLVGEMGLFDAALHTFGTIATGGFSNYSESVAHFGSFRVELIIGVFMFLAGINFAYYQLALEKGWAGWRRAWREAVGSTEVRVYTGLTFGSILMIGTVLWFWGGSNGAEGSDLPDYRSYLQALRDAFFQVICLETSTGYGTADFDRWPQVCRIWLMMLAVIGACAGSTGGGVKVVRYIIAAKAAMRSIRALIRPRALYVVRVDGESLDDAVVSGITGYFVLWIFVFLGGTVFMAVYGIDLESAATAVVATLNNIGPGLGVVGPTLNFAELPVLVKALLTVFMILGRLEFYAVVALFVPSFWRS
jgi:trk system potassium uptake protein TrkH